jgi:ATP-dependent Clp protease, protease subunit
MDGDILREDRFQTAPARKQRDLRMPQRSGRKIAYYGYTGAIDSTGASRVAASLNHAVKERCDEVQLCISSFGGYVSDGMFLYNHIRGLPLRVVTHNTGSVTSIAVAVFLAAEERYCSALGMFMIHPTVISSKDGMTAQRLQSSLDSALADDRRTENILRERAAIPEEILTARRFTDVYITPHEAVIYGLVHAVKEFELPEGEEIVQI